MGRSSQERRCVVVEKLEQRWLLNGSIRGRVIDESDGNRGMSGVSVYIDADEDGTLDAGEVSVLTDSKGVYEFTDVSAITVVLREVVPTGWKMVSPAPTTTLVYDEARGDTFINANYWKVNGTSGSDVITAQVDPGGVKVTVNGVSEVRSLLEFKGLLVRGRGGNDRITLDSQLTVAARIFGEKGNDTIGGGQNNDRLSGGPGDDFILGLGGDDTLLGDNGDDAINGGDGNESIEGGEGANVIHGGDGNDNIQGAAGFGAKAGRCTVFGDGGDDKIIGWGRDKLYGGEGNDVIQSHGVNVSMYGGGGDDDLNSADYSDRDLVDGGTGSDKAAVDKLDTVLNVEQVTVKRPPTQGHGCFLTSAVVHWAGKADDCHELTVLRKFRDGYMRRLPDGQAMIRDYYQYAPAVVAAIEEQGLGKVEWPRVFAMVQEAVKLIEAGRNREALELYSAEYLRLKAQYVELAVV